MFNCAVILIRRVPQARSALIAILPGFGAGMSLSFTTPALDHYKSADVDQPFSKEQGSWFGTDVIMFMLIRYLLILISTSTDATLFAVGAQSLRMCTICVGMSIHLLCWCQVYRA